MQAIMETIFDIAYLTTVISVGLMMTAKSRGSRQYRLFGIMAVNPGGRRCFSSDSTCGGSVHHGA